MKLKPEDKMAILITLIILAGIGLLFRGFMGRVIFGH